MRTRAAALTVVLTGALLVACSHTEDDLPPLPTDTPTEPAPETEPTEEPESLEEPEPDEVREFRSEVTADPSTLEPRANQSPEERQSQEEEFLRRLGEMVPDELDGVRAADVIEAGDALCDQVDESPGLQFRMNHAFAVVFGFPEEVPEDARMAVTVSAVSTLCPEYHEDFWAEVETWD